MKKNPKVKCPKCEEEFNYFDSEFRPFCSERCKMIDLGHWVTGSYSVPSQTPLDEKDLEKILEERSKDDEEQ